MSFEFSIRPSLHIYFELTPLLIALTFVVLIYTLISTHRTSHAICVYHSKATASLIRTPCDDALDNFDKTSTVSLATLLRTQVPSLFHPNASFVPRFYQRSGTAQTLFNLIPRRSSESIVYERLLLRVPDGGTISLDIWPPRTSYPTMNNEKMLVVLHGLAGGSNEPYVLDLINDLQRRRRGCGRRGTMDMTTSEGARSSQMRVVVCNARGCGDTPLTTPRLHHAGCTNDLRCAVLYLTKHFPSCELFGIGFSLGANVLVKYAGELGEQCPLSAIVSVANLWDYAAGAEHLKRGSLANRYFWNYALGHSFCSLLRRHSRVFLEAAHARAPYHFNSISISPSNTNTNTNIHASTNRASLPNDIYSKSLLSLIDVETVINKPLISLTDFIDKFVAPMEGYESSERLYRDASSLHYMKSVKVPCLALNSLDDEITRATLPYAEVQRSEYIFLATTNHGGHLGWFDENCERWYHRPVFEFLDAIISLGPRHRPVPRLHNLEGRWMQEGRDEVGFEVMLS